jgi:Tol biopolymer transport system component
LWWFSRGRIETQPKAIERQITANPLEDWVTGGAISPDGKTLAYHDQTGLYLRSLESGETHAVPLDPAFSNRISYLSWWPDGKRLLVPTTEEGDSSGYAHLWTIRAAGDPAPELLLQDVVNQSISPDGRSLAFTGKGPSNKPSGLWVIRLNDGAAHYLRGLENDLVFSPVWSPDGRWIAYVHFQKTTQGLAPFIEVQPATGGPAKTILSSRGLPGHTLICYLGSSAAPCLAWLSDWRLAFSTFVDASEPGVEEDNGIWEIPMVRGTASPVGRPKRLMRWTDIDAGNLAATEDGKHLSFVKIRTWEDVYLAELSVDSRRMLPARRFTLDNRGSEPSGWMLDSKAILFSSYRTGRPEIFRQAVNSNAPERIAQAPGKNCGGAIMTPDRSWMLYREGVQGTLPPNTPGPPARLMRQQASGGVPEPVLEEPADREWNFACPVKPESSCILAQSEGPELVFYGLDPLRGKGAKIGSIKRTFATGLRDWNVKPDGSQVAFASPAGHIEVLDVHDRTWHEIQIEPGWGKLQSIAWASDGNGFYVTCWLPDSFDLLFVDLTGKVARLIHNGRQREITYPLPSPDGKYLAFDAGTWDSNVWLLENF